jgi:hypothetical protein
MLNGDGVNSKPLPIKHPLELPEGFSESFKIKHCPIYGFSFTCYNLSIMSYGCTYHPLCLVVYMETKSIKCARPSCGKPLSMGWITSFGFKHVNFTWRTPKVEKGVTTLVASATKSFVGSNPTECKHKLNLPYLFFIVAKTCGSFHLLLVNCFMNMVILGCELFKYIVKLLVVQVQYTYWTTFVMFHMNIGKHEC